MKCCNCKQYKSVNDDEGSQLLEKWKKNKEEQANIFANAYGFNANERDGQ